MTDMLAVRLAAGLLARVEVVAATHRVTRSEYVRRILAAAVEEDLRRLREGAEEARP